MTNAIQLGDLFDMPNDLELSLEPGNVQLDRNRMIMLHTGALGSLRKELIDTLGTERARGLLTRMGYASGQRDAELARRLLPNASDEEVLLLGPKLHGFEGVVKVSPIRLDIDIARGHYSAEFLWENSFEAEAHLDNFGVHHESTCWTQIGYATGYTSAVMGRFILYKETECKGKGDRHCRIVGMPAEEFDEAKGDLKYFEPDHVAEQLLQLQAEVTHLRYSLDDNVALGDMVGCSDSFRGACEMLRKAADSHVTVLLLGETGVGKEMCARALHSVSPRQDNSFVAINCAAIPEELIESELFGVEKGAYTGAQSSRPGRFERAHGGTLFLDEVGELSAAAQAKLLRVLQEGEFERVGDTRTRKVDVRLIAATNVNLEQAVEKGEFRADLYYRLNIFPMVIPPLRERAEDIPLLAQHFVDKHTAKHGKRVAGITERAHAALSHYQWPGNIRELENVIERGVIICGQNGMLDASDLFPTLSPTQTPPSSPEPTTLVAEPRSVDEVADLVLDIGISMGDLEQTVLNTAVERMRGNLSGAARLLGITRPQLAYRLQKVSPKDDR